LPPESVRQLPDFAFVFENLGFGKGKAALDKARTWYMEKHQGQPHLPLFMGSEKGTVKLQELKMTQKEMGFFEWQMMLLNRIMAVYGMQPFIIGMNTTSDATGKLDAELQSSEFKKNTIIPLIKTFTNVMNSGLIWNDDNFNFDDIYLTSTNLDIDDEKKQAEIDEAYLDKGVITINQVRNRLQMPPVDWGYMPFVPLNYAPYDTLVKYQQSKISSNLKSAMSDGIDNNVNADNKDNNVNADPKESKKAAGMDDWGTHEENSLEGVYSAVCEAAQGHKDPNEVWHHAMMDKNFKLPTGLEKVEPREVIEAVTKMISERDRKINKVYSLPNFSQSKMISIANDTGLSWLNILE